MYNPFDKDVCNVFENTFAGTLDKLGEAPRKDHAYYWLAESDPLALYYVRHPCTNGAAPDETVMKETCGILNGTLGSEDTAYDYKKGPLTTYSVNVKPTPQNHWSSRSDMLLVRRPFPECRDFVVRWTVYFAGSEKQTDSTIYSLVFFEHHDAYYPMALRSSWPLVGDDEHYDVAEVAGELRLSLRYKMTVLVRYSPLPVLVDVKSISSYAPDKRAEVMCQPTDIEEQRGLSVKVDRANGSHLTKLLPSGAIFDYCTVPTNKPNFNHKAAYLFSCLTTENGQQAAPIQPTEVPEGMVRVPLNEDVNADLLPGGAFFNAPFKELKAYMEPNVINGEFHSPAFSFIHSSQKTNARNALTDANIDQTGPVALKQVDMSSIPYDEAGSEVSDFESDKLENSDIS